MQSKEIVILIGNIGTGKSTYTKKLCLMGYYAISRDAIRYMVGGGNYRFEPDYEPIIFKSEIDIVENYMKCGLPIAVDEVGISKSKRAIYINLAKVYGYKVKVIVMPKLNLTKTLKRKKVVTHGQDAEVWATVYKRFNSEYEKPQKTEGIDEIEYKWIDRDKTGNIKS